MEFFHPLVSTILGVASNTGGQTVGPGRRQTWHIRKG